MLRTLRLSQISSRTPRELAKEFAMASSSPTRDQLLHAVSRILRPIVKALIRTGVRFDEFSELARGVYVESAMQDGVNQAARPTRTRVSIMTGLTRQQVDYYVDNDGVMPSANPTLANILIEVLQKWHTDPQYVGPYGIPLELEFEIPATRSIRSLVAMVDKSVSPGIVLEELIRVGSVTYSGERHFRAVSRYFMMPEAMSPQQIEYFGNTLTRLAETLEFNMNPNNAAKRLERFVVADRGLPADVVPKFESYARERATEFLLDLDNWLTPYSASGTNEAPVRLPTGLNVFLYVGKDVDGAPPDQIVPRGDTRQ
jgi:hypothetical protein